ncbi:MAG: penicillin acylase family protein, partial [Acidobacteriota bacterium]
MSRMLIFTFFIVSVAGWIPQTETPALPPPETLRVEGLREAVEILRDRWGIAHIYAKSESDLFFA